MISISKFAASVLLRNCKEMKIHPGKIFRLNKKGHRYTVQLDTPKQTDHIMCYGDSVVLIVDSNIEKEIGNAYIKVEDGKNYRSLVIERNKNKYEIVSPVILS